jgi:hypothetical protein
LVTPDDITGIEISHCSELKPTLPQCAIVFGSEVIKALAAHRIEPFPVWTQLAAASAG